MKPSKLLKEVINLQDTENNYVGFGLFFFLIVLIVLVCSMLLFFNERNKKQEKRINEQNEVIVSDKNKKDKNKDFIYFTNEETISEELNLIYKLPIINLKSEEAKDINDEIMSYVNQVKNTIVKGKTENCPNLEENSIAKTSYLDYAIYTYQEYITLLIRESNYSCQNGFSSSSKVKAYTFDVLSGNRLSFEALLKKYDITLTEVLGQIRNNLNKEQVIVDGLPTIQVEETINTLQQQDTYVLYIDEFGDLILNYVVKTNSLDYNDTIVVNRK